MKGILTIDNGNTSIKLAFFNSSCLMATSRLPRRDLRLLNRFISTYKPDSAIVCSTAAPAAAAPIEELTRQRCPHVLCLSHDTPLPIALQYRTPETLGRDRIATAVGGWTLARRIAPGNDVLVIDAGTAVTCDLVTADGTFMGGNIAPGMALRFKALHEHTGRLPLIGAEGETPLMGYDTATAIRSGVLRGLTGEVRNHIAEVRSEHPRLTVIFTGGDGRLLCNRLDGEQAIFNEHLAAEGLNRIYLYNQELTK